MRNQMSMTKRQMQLMLDQSTNLMMSYSDTLAKIEERLGTDKQEVDDADDHKALGEDAAELESLINKLQFNLDRPRAAKKPRAMGMTDQDVLDQVDVDQAAIDEFEARHNEEEAEA